MRAAQNIISSAYIKDPTDPQWKDDPGMKTFNAFLDRYYPEANRNLAPAVIGSRMATTTYAILASIQVFMLFALWTPSGVIWWRAMGIVLWFMSSLYMAAWLLLLKAIWDAGLTLQTGFLGWWAIANGRAPV
jgi:hypothetical protein